MNLAQQKCVPCEVGGVPLTKEEAEVLLRETPAWKLSDTAQSISRQFAFEDFAAAMAFANAIAAIAEQEGHHPDLTIGWGKVGVELSTHSMHGLSQNDFILAAKIDTLAL